MIYFNLRPMEKIGIKNIVGSHNISKKPNDGTGSWIKFWEKRNPHKFNPFDLYECPGCGRYKFGYDFCGCHVRKYRSLFDDKWYIVPMCSDCNKQSGECFSVGDKLLTPLNP